MNMFASLDERSTFEASSIFNDKFSREIKMLIELFTLKCKTFYFIVRNIDFLIVNFDVFDISEKIIKQFNYVDIY